MKHKTPEITTDTDVVNKDTTQPKKPYQKPELKTHEPLEIVSAYQDRSSELVF